MRAMVTPSSLFQVVPTFSTRHCSEYIPVVSQDSRALSRLRATMSKGVLLFGADQVSLSDQIKQNATRNVRAWEIVRSFLQVPEKLMTASQPFNGALNQSSTLGIHKLLPYIPMLKRFALVGDVLGPILALVGFNHDNSVALKSHNQLLKNHKDVLEKFKAVNTQLNTLSTLIQESHQKLHTELTALRRRIDDVEGRVILLQDSDLEAGLMHMTEAFYWLKKLGEASQSMGPGVHNEQKGFSASLNRAKASLANAINKSSTLEKRVDAKFNYAICHALSGAEDLACQQLDSALQDISQEPTGNNYIAAAQLVNASHDSQIATLFTRLALYKAVKADKDEFGHEYIASAIGYYKLGVAIAQESGKPDLQKSEDALNKALTIGENIFSTNHPFLALTCKSLGSVLINQNKRAEALSVLKKGSAIAEKTLGASHKLALEIRQLQSSLDSSN